MFSAQLSFVYVYCEQKLPLEQRKDVIDFLFKHTELSDAISVRLLHPDAGKVRSSPLLLAGRRESSSHVFLLHSALPQQDDAICRWLYGLYWNGREHLEFQRSFPYRWLRARTTAIVPL